MLKTIQWEIKEVYRFRYVLYSYIETSLKLRYRRSVLGFLWTVLAPMLHYLVMGLVFSVLMRDRMTNYFVFYFSGALFFSIITTTLNRAPGVFLTNENFIKKIYVPKLLFILNGTAYEIVNFLLSGTALIILGLIFKKIQLSPFILISFIPVILIMALLVGLGAIISVAAVYFRDLLHIVPVLLQACFFVTPVIYEESMIPEKYHFLIKLNPFYYYLELFRQPLLYQTLPSIKFYGIAGAMSILFLLTGIWVVKLFDNKIVFKL